MNDLIGAIKISTYLLGFVFFVFNFRANFKGDKRYHNKTGTKFRLNRIQLSKKRPFSLGYFVALYYAGFVIPFTRLLSWALYINLDSSNIDIIKGTLNTILLSIVAAFLITFIAFFINFIKNFYNNRFFEKTRFFNYF